MANRYDIFISYRRDGGQQYARILQMALAQKGYKVFLDYDELSDGIFGEKIKAAIIEAPIFIIVLSKGALERCKSEKDWVRNEILFAISQKKYIININPDDTFDGIPEDIPDEIKYTIGSLQHTNIGFSSTQDTCVDFLVTHRIIPVLGARKSLNSTNDTNIDERKDSNESILHKLFKFISRTKTVLL